MYATIERWQRSGLSQIKFSNQEQISKATFLYWLKKYRKEKEDLVDQAKSPTSFIPVEVSSQDCTISSPSDHILISYPGGIQISCPVSVSAEQLKTLLTI